MKTKLLVLLLTVVLTFTACNGSGNVSNVSSEGSDVSDITDSSGTASVSDDESTQAEASADESENEVSEEESEPAEESENSVPETSVPSGDTSVPDNSTGNNDEQVNECRVTIKACRFSEKPYAVVVGKCDEGAKITLQCGNKTYTSESWYGWYSVRFLCTASKAEVTITQTINGKQVGFSLKQTVYPTAASTVEGVVAGGNFQFFYQKCLRDFQHTNLYSSGVLNSLKKRVEGRIDTLESAGMDTEIIYMVVPAAMTVYPELVPEQYKQGSGDSRMDQVLDTLSSAGATVIDLRTAFEEHKNDEYPLYFKTDSHWTDYGAFIAYQELFNHISKTYLDAAPLSFDDFNWKGDYYKSGDMPVYLNMISQSVYENGKISNADILEYGWYRTFGSGISVNKSITNVPRYRADVQMVYSTKATWPYEFYTNRNNLPSCVVMHDSFGTQIFDILAERMNTTIYPAMWDYSYNRSVIINNELDYVIYILAEWNLDSVVYN